MFFDSEKARKFLEENGFAATFRTYNYTKNSHQQAKHHDETGHVVLFAGIIVCNLKDVYSCEDIEPFAEFSGFEGAEEWADEIFRLDKIRLPLRGGFKKLGNLCFVAQI